MTYAAETSSALQLVHSMASYLTADLCDAHEQTVENGELMILAPIFKPYGRQSNFRGRIATVKVFEDNVLVRQTLSQNGDGRVLVVDGGASLRCALLGGNLAVLAQEHGWAGIVVNGCVRDVDEINTCDIGVRALASHPLKSKKRGQGEVNVPLDVAGVRIHPGDWCYADNDGVLVSKVELKPQL